MPYLALALISSFSCNIDTTIRGNIGLPLENDLHSSIISYIVGSHLNLEIENGDGLTVLGAWSVLRFRHQWKVFMRYHCLCTEYKDHTSILY